LKESQEEHTNFQKDSHAAAHAESGNMSYGISMEPPALQFQSQAPISSSQQAQSSQANQSYVPQNQLTQSFVPPEQLAPTATASKADSWVPGWVSDGAAAISSTAKKGADMVASGASTAYTATKEGAGALLDGAKEVGSTIHDGASSALAATKRGVQVADTVIKESTKQVVTSVGNGTSAVIAATRKGVAAAGSAVKENVQEAGAYVKETGASLVDKAEEVITKGADTAKVVGQATLQTIDTTIDVTKEFGAKAIEQAQEVGSKTKAAAVQVVDQLKETGKVVKDKSIQWGTASVNDALSKKILGVAGTMDVILGPESTAIGLENLPNQHAFDEYVAKNLSYLGDGNTTFDLKEEHQNRLDAEGFQKENNTITGKEGFQMSYILPKSGVSKNPILATRGSEADSDFFNDWGSDFDWEQVGDRQFNANKAEIEAVINFLAAQSPTGKVDLTGHSLGGGLAQRILAHFPDKIGRLTTFQAPGQSKETMDLYQQNTAKMTAEGKALPEVAHHVEDQGIVYLVGEGHIPGNFYKHNVGHYNLASAHTVRLTDGVKDHKIDQYSEFPDRFRGAQSEALRKGAGKALVPAFNALDKKTHYERNQYNQAVPKTEPVDDPNWELLPDAKSVYHQNGIEGKGNRKYVSKDGGHLEAVYDQDGNLVTDPTNLGTYNFEGPDNVWGHFHEDVLPYWLYGNSEEDKTPLKNRIFGPRIIERLKDKVGK